MIVVRKHCNDSSRPFRKTMYGTPSAGINPKFILRMHKRNYSFNNKGIKIFAEVLWQFRQTEKLSQTSKISHHFRDTSPRSTVYTIMTSKKKDVLSRIPSLFKAPCAPPLVLVRCISNEGGSTRPFSGVTTRYCKRSASNIETELRQLQRATSTGLENSWEEATHIKKKLDARREVVENLERELRRLKKRSRLKQTHMGRWDLSSISLQRKQNSTPKSTMQRSPLCLPVNRPVRCSWYIKKDQQQKRYLQNHRATLLGSVLGNLGLKSHVCQKREINLKITSLQLSHKDMVSDLRQKLHQKDLAKAAIQRHVELIKDCILKQQQIFDSQRALLYQDKNERSKERDNLVRKVMVISGFVMRKDIQLQKMQHHTMGHWDQKTRSGLRPPHNLREFEILF